MPSRPQSIIRSPGTVIALILSLLIAVSTFVTWSQYVRVSDRTRSMAADMIDLKDLLIDLLDTESSARGFLLSQDDKILHQFDIASAAVQRSCMKLSRAQLDFGERKPLLDNLLAATRQKLSGLRSTVDFVRRDPKSRIAAAQAIQRDDALLVNVRNLDTQAEDYLQEALVATRNRSRFFARLSQLITALGCVGVFAMVFFSRLNIQRLVASGLRLNQELSVTNQDLGQFVYSASHDLQEPLRVLMLYSDLIDRNVRNGRPVATEIKHLRTAAQHMSALVFDLLTYTQVLTGPKDPNASSDLKLATAKALDNLRALIDQTQAEFSIDNLPVLPMEGSHAELLLENIFSNSLKYRHSDRPPHIAISARRENGKWVISVADNGIGVDPAYHGQIFGIFKRLHPRTAYPGTGLGLAICRKIVEHYGGVIWIESELGKGSTFRFSVRDSTPSKRFTAARLPGTPQTN